MLEELVAMYEHNVTNRILGTALITTTKNLRQGSCLLFPMYINDLNKIVKENCELDSFFLSWVHILNLMDDIVLLSMNRT